MFNNDEQHIRDALFHDSPSLSPAQRLEEVKVRNEENLAKLRMYVGYGMLWLTFMWTLFVIFVVCSAGMGWLWLDVKVIITLLSTTTINVFLMVRAIIKSLYPDESKNKENQ
jgi:hypothetical protein